MEADIHVCVKIARALGFEHALLLSATRRGPSAHGRVTSSARLCASTIVWQQCIF